MKQPTAKLECLACGHAEHRMSEMSVGDLALEDCPKCGGDMIVTSKGEAPPRLERIVEIVNRHFQIWDFVGTSDEMELLVESNQSKESFSELLSELKEIGYTPLMREKNGEISLKIKRSPEIRQENVLWNVVLLLATIGTTFGIAGYLFLYPHNVLQAALFSGSLMTILGTHEMGHKIAMWHYDVKATWPYFLPVPHPYIGTLGAFIKVKSPIPTKGGLIGMGASGPILGFLIALPIAAVGLGLSNPAGGEIFQLIPVPLSFVFLGTLKFGHFPITLQPHPLAWASFIGLLVTWLNLTPAGTLDGGHVARALLGRDKQYLLTRMLGLGLILLGIVWLGFTFWGIFILFLFGSPHPGALDDVSDLRNEQKSLAAVALGVFLLTLPVPMGLF